MKTNVFKTSLMALVLAFTGVKAFNSAVANSESKISTKPDLNIVAMNNLEYDFAKASIRNDYYDELDNLAKTIKQADYAISLRGHADSIGDYVANWKLSDKRALEVKEYLVSKGVKSERIVTTPYGSTLPIAPNTTAEGRQKNRRVEIKLKETK